uniref:Avirulence protein AvrP123 n=1 Tax=Melampsora lini TaxID=5261 RepID=B2ZCT1_MELLI|nr:avirulence protein AvrP123 [Melampsora lini]
MLFKQCTALKFLIFILGFSIIAAQSNPNQELGVVECLCRRIAPLTQPPFGVRCRATLNCPCDYIGDCPGPAEQYMYRCPNCGPRSHVACSGVHRGTCQQVHPGIASVQYQD